MKSVPQKDLCPIAEASALIGDMWVILIIRDLLKGSRRFCELQDSLISHENVQINTRTLTTRLKMLEDIDLVKRTVIPHSMPPHVEYSLTKKGAALSPVIDTIRSYGKKHLC